jgi:DNA-binding XRE family transcriptional regulator
MKHAIIETAADRPAARASGAGELLTQKQVAEFFGVEPFTIRTWQKTKCLPCLRVSKKVIRYRLSEIEMWLEKFRPSRRLSKKEAA